MINEEFKKNIEKYLNQAQTKLIENLMQMKTTIDYKELLIKYIEHIGQMEGVDYINYIKPFKGPTLMTSSVPFSIEEKTELELLSKAYDKYKYEENDEKDN